jgi:ParB/RepB/Spo0J family partition protein
MKFTKAEIDAVIEASPRTFVPFNKLVLSQDYQARAGGNTPKMSIVELAASIKECGVLQNLVIVQGARGRYEVCAGGRRLEALTLLVGKGDLADNYPVPVLVVPADRALIASLSENCFHIPIHPADEFAAFAKLVGQGKSVEDVAAAFGITPLVVKRRMKLATVSPKLMALFREDQIGLDCLMVLASVNDQQKQEQTWAALPSWNRRPDYLRQLLSSPRCGPHQPGAQLLDDPTSARSCPSRALHSGKTVATRPAQVFAPTSPEERIPKRQAQRAGTGTCWGCRGSKPDGRDSAEARGRAHERGGGRRGPRRG